uniref:Uncharacterized protein n=1 Tax=Parascaris univalens TaxID=6257 RepID=A0A914ZWW7_PARUN
MAWKMKKRISRWVLGRRSQRPLSWSGQHLSVKHLLKLLLRMLSKRNRFKLASLQTATMSQSSPVVQHGGTWVALPMKKSDQLQTSHFVNWRSYLCRSLRTPSSSWSPLLSEGI